MSVYMHETVFKKCPGCGWVWPTRDSFLNDATLSMNGYQADFERLEDGLFLVTHTRGTCWSTLAIVADQFLDMYTGPRYSERKTLTEECPRLCREPTQLSRCKAACECAYVREVVHIVKNRLIDARPIPQAGGVD